MKVIVAVCVYNRLENIKLWIRCWRQCVQHNAELVVIHNYYGDENELQKFKSLCDQHKIKYVPRNGKGFDIGMFQDVIKERLTGFDNDWDILLWCTDDTIPMSKDFLSLFLDKLKDPCIGIACMELSPSVTWHVRTTGFAIRKEIANKLQFPADPVTTKQECYMFEHRAGFKTMYGQIKAMGLISMQVALSEISPLWDTGYWKRLMRQEEHDAVFPPEKMPGDKVVFIVPIFDMYPAIISSLICQTHPNWELLLIHNGPELNGLDTIVKNYNEPRVKFIVYPEQTGKWGHVLRQWALKELDTLCSDADYVVISNADNYHAPVYNQYLLDGFNKSHTAVATYCSQMVHSYKAWQVIPVSFKLGFIDCCGVMVKKNIAVEIGWRDVDSHSSDFTYFSDIAAKYSQKNFIPVRGCLITHN